MDQARGKTQSIALICYGAHRDVAERLSAGLAPNFTFTAIVSAWTAGSEKDRTILNALLQHLHPSPAGILVGGAFDDTKKQDIKQIAQQHGIRFAGVPCMYMKDHTPEETLQWIRNALEKEFGLE